MYISQPSYNNIGITALKYDKIETTEGIMLAKDDESALPVYVKLNCLVVQCCSLLTFEVTVVYESGSTIKPAEKMR